MNQPPQHGETICHYYLVTKTIFIGSNNVFYNKEVIMLSLRKN